MSMSLSLFTLLRAHASGKQEYSSLGMLVDAVMIALFLGIYIAGIVILAKSQHRYTTYAQGIPHIYSNLSCLIML